MLHSSRVDHQRILSLILPYGRKETSKKEKGTIEEVRRKVENQYDFERRVISIRSQKEKVARPMADGNKAMRKFFQL